MAGFLRKKSKQEAPEPPRPAVPASSSPPTSTPLFARFATSAPQPEQQRVVSGPMTLSSSARRDVQPVAQHRSHSTRGISNGVPINGQVRRDNVDQKQARDLPPLQSRPSYTPTQPQPRARPTSRVSLDKPILPPLADPVPAPKPIPTSSALYPPQIQTRPVSSDFSIGGEYAHLWSVIAGDDPNILGGSPPSSNPTPLNDRNPSQNNGQPPSQPLQPTYAQPKTSNPDTLRSPERPTNGFPTSHTYAQPANAGKHALEKPNDPSRHDLLTDPNYGRRINSSQGNGNAPNFRTTNPMEGPYAAAQPAPPPPIKPNGSIPKSRPTSTYMQQLPPPAQKPELNQNVLPSPSNSPDSYRNLPRTQGTTAYNGQLPPAARSDKSLPPTSPPEPSRRLSVNPAMGASSSSLGSHSLRSSVYKDIRTEDLSSPPNQRNITQQPTPPVSPPQQPRKSASMRQSFTGPPSLGKGKPLIFAAMASVDPEPGNDFAPAPTTPASNRQSLMSAPPQMNQPPQAWNNVPPQHQQRHQQPPQFQNHNQFQQAPPPQSYRPPPQGPEGVFPSRQPSLNQQGRGPIPPQQPPPPGQYQQQQQQPGPPRNNSIRWNDRPLPQPGPVYPTNGPPPPNNHPPPQSFQQPQNLPPSPPPPHGPRPSNSPPRDTAAQLRTSPEPAHRASPTKGRRLSKKPPPGTGSDVASVRSQNRPNNGIDKSQPGPPQPQFQQRLPPQQQQQQQQQPLPPHHHHNHLVKPPQPPVVSITPGPPPHMGPPSAEKMSVDRDPVGVPLNDDPFAKSDGVKMLSPFSKDNRGDFLGSEYGDASDAFHSASGSPSPRLSQNMEPISDRGTLVDGEAEDAEAMPSIEEIPNDGNDRLTAFLINPALLANLLSYFSFFDWCTLLGLSREIRFRIVQNAQTREAVLERFLRTVGYSRWIYDGPDPLSLSLQDLADYMRGVSTPTHEYARVASLYIHSLGVHPTHRDHSLDELVATLSAATRAYTRVVLRLRAQAEKEASVARRNGRNSGSRPGSRAPSPTQSVLSQSNQGHPSPQRPVPVKNGSFQSPLFRVRRAPLLRVFVPSPDGDWLSDKSLLECEAELRKAGVSHLMRMGDVVWDVAVGDEGNVGRLVWDGTYLIDLDYTYAAAGDLPKYIPTLAFPPSYFHRVIRSGAGTSNPIAHIDITPWGEEVAANLQLLQDRVRTETPQGAYHNVVRWVHRSSFQVRPLPRNARAPSSYNRGGSPHQSTTRIPLPNSNLFVDPGWYGTIVLETEGTNEALADLQERCGPRAFPPRPKNHYGNKGLPAEQDRKLVYRIMREKSRPGEIWVRTVSAKERLL